MVSAGPKGGVFTSDMVEVALAEPVLHAALLYDHLLLSYDLPPICTFQVSLTQLPDQASILKGDAGFFYHFEWGRSILKRAGCFMHFEGREE